MDENPTAAGGESAPKTPAFKAQFEAPEDHRLIAFGAADGSTHKLHARNGVITAHNPEDAEYLNNVVGLKQVEATPAADKADKEA